MTQIPFDWNLTSKINKIAGTPIPWLKKLEEIAEAILRACNSDAVWLLTLPPLRVAAAGILRTPLEVEPHAVIALSDASPPISNNWPPAQSMLSQVLQSGEPKFGNHLLQNGDQIDHDLGDVLLQFSELDVQAIVPIGVSDECYGVIIIGNQEGKTSLDDNFKQILKYVGQHLALTLQNSSLLETAQHQARQLATLNRIARTITSSLDLDEVVQLTMTGIDETLDVEAGALLLLDESKQELYFKIILRGVESVVTDHRLRIGEGIAGWVFLHQEAALVNNVSKDPRFSPRIDDATGFDTKSVLCAPLIVNGRAIGALEVINKRQGYFTLDDQDLLTSMTASLAIALENSHLFQRVQDQVKHMEQINSLTADINARLSFAETTESIVAEMSKLFTFDSAVLGLLDEHKLTVQNTMLDRQGAVVHQLQPIPVNESYLRQLLSSNQDYMGVNLAEPAPFAEHKWLQTQDAKSVAAILLRSENNEFGLFSLVSKVENAFTANDLRRLSQLSSTLSTTLEKARLMDTMEQRTAELEELNLLGERLLTNTDPQFILDTALEYIPRLLPASVHGLALIDGDITNLGLRLPKETPQTLIDDITQEIVETLKNSLHDQQTVKLAGVRITNADTVIPQNWHPQSKLVWPILTLRGSLGVVYLAYKDQSAITANQMRLFSLIVSRISGTIENSYLFKEIEQERARLAAILRSTPDGIVVVDKSGRVIVDNPAANQILENASSQRGQLLKEAIDNEDLLSLFEQAEKSGNAAGEFTTLEDKTYYTSVSSVETLASIGKTSVIGWVAVMQNVTHFKELNAAKDSFVNAVSHDLRAPLSGIALASQLIEMTGELSDRQSQFLNTIQDHIGRMTKLIDDLLDVGKIEADIDMKMDAHVVTPIIEEAIEGLKPQAEQKKLALITELEEEVAEVKGNATRLQQVFSNLISNAIKYTPEQGEVKVRLSQQDDYILFQVTDNGVGIPQADQPHIFEKFYRVRGEHMTGIKGSGLGLAITKSIIDKHRGTIWVDSKFKGGGSTFSVLLPTIDH